MLPDLVLRKAEVGQPVSAEGQEAWDFFEALFSQRVSPRRPPKPPRRGRRPSAWGEGQGAEAYTAHEGATPGIIASHRVVMCLGALLTRTSGKGLSHHAPSLESQPTRHAQLRPTLSLHIDEGSTGYDMAWCLAIH